MESVIKIKAEVVDKIIEHCMRHPDLECGGFILGKYKKTYDGQILTISDIYKENRVGVKTAFVFARAYYQNAIEYSKDTSQKLIGCYHSHGLYSAKFSEPDRVLELFYAHNNAALIYSPMKNEMIGDIITTEKKVYESRITIINSDDVERLYYPKLPTNSSNKVLSLKKYQK